MSDWRDTLTIALILFIVISTESSPSKLSTPGAYARMLLDPGVFSFKEAAMPKVEVNPGDRYGRFTVVKELEPKTYPSGKKGRMVKCVCTCGAISAATLNNLRTGKMVSCGCHKREQSTRHGLRDSPLYDVWYQMVRRCTDPGHIGYHRYGGRGITVCETWAASLEDFVEWANNAGWEPGLQLDRVDNDGDYEPDNCRFITPRKNARNRNNHSNITCFGRTQCMSEWEEETGINRCTIRDRIKRGWSVEDALTKEVQHV